MLEQKVTKLLTKALSAYIDNLSKENLSISLKRATVKNVRLREDVLQNWNLPFTVKKGLIRQIDVHLPSLRKLLSGGQMTVEVKDILLIIRPLPDYELKAEKVKERSQRMKERNLEAWEAWNQSITPSKGKKKGNRNFRRSLVEKLIDNLILNVSNIDVRYEDSLSTPGHPFVFGVSLKELTLQSVDHNGFPVVFKERETLIRKLMGLSGLKVYGASDAQHVSDAFLEKRFSRIDDEVFAIRRLYDTLSVVPLLEDFRLTVQVMMNREGARLKTGKYVTQTTADITIDTVSLHVEENNVRDILQLLIRMKAQRRIMQLMERRPISMTPQQRWRYAIESVIVSLRGALEKNLPQRTKSWEEMVAFRNSARRYVDLYQRTVLFVEASGGGRKRGLGRRKDARERASSFGTPSKSALPGLILQRQDLEQELTYDEIILFRTIAIREFHRKYEEAIGDNEETDDDELALNEALSDLQDDVEKDLPADFQRFTTTLRLEKLAMSLYSNHELARIHLITLDARRINCVFMATPARGINSIVSVESLEVVDAQPFFVNTRVLAKEQLSTEPMIVQMKNRVMLSRQSKKGGSFLTVAITTLHRNGDGQAEDRRPELFIDARILPMTVILNVSRLQLLAKTFVRHIDNAIMSSQNRFWLSIQSRSARLQKELIIGSLVRQRWKKRRRMRVDVGQLKAIIPHEGTRENIVPLHALEVAIEHIRVSEDTPSSTKDLAYWSATRQRKSHGEGMEIISHMVRDEYSINVGDVNLCVVIHESGTDTLSRSKIASLPPLNVNVERSFIDREIAHAVPLLNRPSESVKRALDDYGKVHQQASASKNSGDDLHVMPMMEVTLSSDEEYRISIHYEDVTKLRSWLQRPKPQEELRRNSNTDLKNLVLTKEEVYTTKASVLRLRKRFGASTAKQVSALCTVKDGVVDISFTEVYDNLNCDIVDTTLDHNSAAEEESARCIRLINHVEGYEVMLSFKNRAIAGSFADLFARSLNEKNDLHVDSMLLSLEDKTMSRMMVSAAFRSLQLRLSSERLSSGGHDKFEEGTIVIAEFQNPCARRVSFGSGHAVLCGGCDLGSVSIGGKRNLSIVRPLYAAVACEGQVRTTDEVEGEMICDGKRTSASLSVEEVVVNIDYDDLVNVAHVKERMAFPKEVELATSVQNEHSEQENKPSLEAQASDMEILLGTARLAVDLSASLPSTTLSDEYCTFAVKADGVRVFRKKAKAGASIDSSVDLRLCEVRLDCGERKMVSVGPKKGEDSGVILFQRVTSSSRSLSVDVGQAITCVERAFIDNLTSVTSLPAVKTLMNKGEAKSDTTNEAQTDELPLVITVKVQDFEASLNDQARRATILLRATNIAMSRAKDVSVGLSLVLSSSFDGRSHTLLDKVAMSIERDKSGCLSVKTAALRLTITDAVLHAVNLLSDNLQKRGALYAFKTAEMDREVAKKARKSSHEQRVQAFINSIVIVYQGPEKELLNILSMAGVQASLSKCVVEKTDEFEATTSLDVELSLQELGVLGVVSIAAKAESGLSALSCSMKSEQSSSLVEYRHGKSFTEEMLNRSLRCELGIVRVDVSTFLQKLEQLPIDEIFALKKKLLVTQEKEANSEASVNFSKPNATTTKQKLTLSFCSLQITIDEEGWTDSGGIDVRLEGARDIEVIADKKNDLREQRILVQSPLGLHLSRSSERLNRRLLLPLFQVQISEGLTLKKTTTSVRSSLDVCVAGLVDVKVLIDATQFVKTQKQVLLGLANRARQIIPLKNDDTPAETANNSSGSNAVSSIVSRNLTLPQLTVQCFSVDAVDSQGWVVSSSKAQLRVRDCVAAMSSRGSRKEASLMLGVSLSSRIKASDGDKEAWFPLLEEAKVEARLQSYHPTKGISLFVSDALDLRLSLEGASGLFALKEALSGKDVVSARTSTCLGHEGGVVALENRCRETLSIANGTESSALHPLASLAISSSKKIMFTNGGNTFEVMLTKMMTRSTFHPVHSPPSISAVVTETKRGLAIEPSVSIDCILPRGVDIGRVVAKSFDGSSEDLLLSEGRFVGPLSLCLDRRWCIVFGGDEKIIGDEEGTAEGFLFLKGRDIVIAYRLFTYKIASQWCLRGAIGAPATIRNCLPLSLQMRSRTGVKTIHTGESSIIEGKPEGRKLRLQIDATIAVNKTNEDILSELSVVLDPIDRATKLVPWDCTYQSASGRRDTASLLLGVGRCEVIHQKESLFEIVVFAKMCVASYIPFLVHVEARQGQKKKEEERLHQKDLDPCAREEQPSLMFCNGQAGSTTLTISSTRDPRKGAVASPFLIPKSSLSFSLNADGLLPVIAKHSQIGKERHSPFFMDVFSLSVEVKICNDGDADILVREALNPERVRMIPAGEYIPASTLSGTLAFEFTLNSDEGRGLMWTQAVDAGKEGSWILSIGSTSDERGPERRLGVVVKEQNGRVRIAAKELRGEICEPWHETSSNVHKYILENRLDYDICAREVSQPSLKRQKHGKVRDSHCQVFVSSGTVATAFRQVPTADSYELELFSHDRKIAKIHPDSMMRKVLVFEQNRLSVVVLLKERVRHIILQPQGAALDADEEKLLRRSTSEEDSVPQLSATIQLDHVCLALFVAQTELLQLHFDGVRGELYQTETERCARLTIEDFQVDNQVVGSSHQVMIQPALVSREDKVMSADVRMLRSEEERVMHVVSVALFVAPLRVEVDEMFVLFLLSRLPDLSDEISSIRPKDLVAGKENKEEIVGQEVPLLLSIESGHVFPIAVDISYFTGYALQKQEFLLAEPSKNKGAVAKVEKLLRYFVTNLEDLPLRLPGLRIEHVVSDSSSMMRSMKRFYTTGIGEHVLKAVGSFAAIGSPVRVANTVGNGLSDFVNLPAREYKKNKSAQAVMEGVARGTVSLLASAVSAPLLAVSRVSGSVSKTFMSASLDRRLSVSRSGRDMRGLAAGGKAAAMSLLKAVTAIFVKPIEGGIREGAKGAMKGLGQGLASTAALPATAVLQGVSSLSGALSGSLTSLSKRMSKGKLRPAKVRRRRAPLQWPSNSAEGFTNAKGSMASMMLSILTEADRGQFYEEGYVTHWLLPSGCLLLTCKSVVCLRLGSPHRVLFSFCFEDMMRIERRATTLIVHLSRRRLIGRGGVGAALKVSRKIECAVEDTAQRVMGELLWRTEAMADGARD